MITEVMHIDIFFFFLFLSFLMVINKYNLLACIQVWENGNNFCFLLSPQNMLFEKCLIANYFAIASIYQCFAFKPVGCANPKG